MKNDILYSVKAHRGPTLRCKGWKQEVLLRMLENNMENAERPERLVIYGGIGKCARNWESYWAIVDSLLNLENDETLAVQSGMPVAIFKTHRLAPRVVMANTNIMKATWPIFYDLQDKNLTMFAQYTAGPWEYIGTQGVIQGTFETLAAVADQHFGGSLAGRMLFTAGLGGMGANQPRAMTMHGGVCLDVDANPEIIDRRIQRKYLDVKASNLEEGIALAERAKTEGRPLAIGLHGNAAEVFPQALALGWRPDIVTEMCPCHDPLSYIPKGYTPQGAEAYRKADRLGYLASARASMKQQLKAMLGFQECGVQVFEYGTSIRKECRERGHARGGGDAHPRLRGRLHPPALYPGARPVPLDMRLGRSERPGEAGRRRARHVSSRHDHGQMDHPGAARFAHRGAARVCATWDSESARHSACASTRWSGAASWRGRWLSRATTSTQVQSLTRPLNRRR